MDNKSFNRRRFLTLAGPSTALLPLVFSSAGRIFADARKPAPSLYRPIAPVELASQLVMNVRSFGAAGNGVAKDTSAIQEAIDRCAVLGGGRVILPPGRYLTGAITLRSNLVLHIEKGATLIGSPDAHDYPITQVRWEGKWIPGHIGLIHGIGIENVAIIGEGSVMGADVLGGRPSPADPLRHPALIEFIQCRHVQLEGIATHYHHMWSLHPTHCEDVLIRNMRITSSGGNGDGIDVDSCRHVHIDACDISTGDDCISLKSGRGSEGYDLDWPTEDVLITNCTFSDANFACIGIGSEMSAGIRNVRIEHCSCRRARTFAIYFKSRIGRGGSFENFAVHRFRAAGMAGGFLRIDMLNSGLQDQNPVPGLQGIPWARNLSFSEIQVSDCPVLVDAFRIPSEKPLEDFSFTNVSGTCEQGLDLANMRGVTLTDLHVTGYRGPLIRIHDVTGSGLSGAVQVAGPGQFPPLPAEYPPYTLH